MYKIYKITNLANTKPYIGLTKRTIEARFQTHIYEHKRRNNILYNAMRKHGVDNFYVEKIDGAETLDEAKSLEVYWINYYKSNHCRYPNNGYNMTDGGEGFDGYVMTDDVRQKISESNKGKVHPEESIQKMRESKKGHVVNEETRRKISETKKKQNKKHTDEFKQYLRELNIGRTHTDEVKRQISESKLGKKRSPETIKKMSESRKGQKAWNKGVKMSEQEKHQIRLNNLIDRFNGLLCEDFVFDIFSSSDYEYVNNELSDSNYQIVVGFFVEKFNDYSYQTEEEKSEYQKVRRRFRRIHNDLRELYKEVS